MQMKVLLNLFFSKGNEKPEVSYSDRKGYGARDRSYITKSLINGKIGGYWSKKLKGQVKISGSKNASLPILAATLLSR